MAHKRGHRVALTVASLGATAGLMAIALPLVPQVSANLDNAAMAEMGMIPEMPVPHVMRYGAIAYAPSARGVQLRATTPRHKQNRSQWTAATIRTAASLSASICVARSRPTA
ncbi:hypothetical protein Mkiyose1665_55090 [Mycobacterium kiyosense]|nr:hypothetical protein SRL2020130_50910 [Mycobacterium kiyosense]GLC05202.1 hypothetical protein SRL2020400_57930 [Mycobacterium kiyosense]GLC10230.1 hypothetical protein SRL2020411_48760 [Mycobacterium kiyosense]GLC16463.1 hypothetical protein SRL2020448_50660 [Mycobacterium kiyosense]GLC23032.1 hypothetical protein SRL2020472_56030 [Mycobacterium kiyosense]